MPPIAHQVRPADPYDLETIETTLGSAFADDPVWSWVLGREDAERVGPILTAFARLHLPEGDVWVTNDGAAAAIWAAPGHWRVRAGAFLRHGTRPLLRAGLGSLPRFWALSETEKRHPREKHWYLAVLGTRPDRQGEGLGSAVMKPVLDRCDEDGMPAYLESSKESNIAFYHRHGFEVTGTLDFKRGGPRVWLMWREPQLPEAA